MAESGTQTVARSTGEGAVQGGIAGGPWGALIGGIVGLLGGVVGVRAQERAEDEKRDLEQRIKRELGIKLLRKRTARLLPIERGAAIGELKGRIETQAAANLARKGLTGSGTGEAVRGISTAVTDLEANRRAVVGARGIGVNKARALGAEIDRIVPRRSPGEAALLGFTKGALLASRGRGDPEEAEDNEDDSDAVRRAKALLGDALGGFDEGLNIETRLPGLIPAGSLRR